MRTASVAPQSPVTQLAMREAILSHYIASDIPITENELECAIRPSPPPEFAGLLSNDQKCLAALGRAQKEKVRETLFRAVALMGEPTTVGSERYSEFLSELPFRIEWMFVRYRLLNLMRESETLGNLDDRCRLGMLDREHLIHANRQIRITGSKYPHLLQPDSELEKMSDDELGFYLRQAYLNYLRGQGKKLSECVVARHSSLVREHSSAIDKHLELVAGDVIYRELPRRDDLEYALMRRFGQALDHEE